MDSILHEYADFLAKYQWETYTTITFRQKRTDSIYWTSKIWNTLEKFDCCRAFIASEPHMLEGIHFHLLTAHTYEETSGKVGLPLNRKALWSYCFKAYGRTLVEPIRQNDQLAVSRYCSKYVVKGNNFDFLGDAW